MYSAVRMVLGTHDMSRQVLGKQAVERMVNIMREAGCSIPNKDMTGSIEMQFRWGVMRSPIKRSKRDVESDIRHLLLKNRLTSIALYRYVFFIAGAQLCILVFISMN